MKFVPFFGLRDKIKLITIFSVKTLQFCVIRTSDSLSFFTVITAARLRLILLESNRINLRFDLYFTAWKVSVFGVFLVRIFPHSDWIRRKRISPYLVRMRKSMNQKISEYGHFSRSNYLNEVIIFDKQKSWKYNISKTSSIILPFNIPESYCWPLLANVLFVYRVT